MIIDVNNRIMNNFDYQTLLLLIGGPCLIHTLSGELLHIMSVPSYCQRPFQVCVSDHGLIVVNFTDNKGYLIVFTSNGRLLYQRELQDRILVCTNLCSFSDT